MAAPPPPPSYHERQKRLCCGVHTLNNLFQSQWLTSAAMDGIANRVAAEAGQGGLGSSAYRSLLPFLGNYDILVLVEALKGKGARLSRHLLANAQLDAEMESLRKTLALPASQRPGGGIQGLIINRRSRNPLTRWLLDGRHWLAIVPTTASVDGETVWWWDVDSKLDAPLKLGGVDEMLAYVRKIIVDEDGQAFLVEIGEESGAA